MKTSLKLLLVLMLAVFGITFLYHEAQVITTVTLPTSGEKPVLYSGQGRNDLLSTYQQAIGKANKSIFLMVYSLTDPTIIQALKKKASEGVDITVICDGKATPRNKRRLGRNIRVYPFYRQGLMHLKILVIDGSTVLLGSANMTRQSLRMHGNLVVGFDDKDIASFIEERGKEILSGRKQNDDYFKSFISGGQDVELWFLPGSSRAIRRVINLIESASKTVRIAMFTWTRRDFAEAVIRAQLRGVKVEVALDNNASKGAGAKVAKLLFKEHVPVKVNTDIGLLHHKFMVVDRKTLLVGSANWTKAAFTENQDCFTIVSNISDEQNKKLDSVWRAITTDSRKFVPKEP